MTAGSFAGGQKERKFLHLTKITNPPVYSQDAHFCKLGSIKNVEIPVALQSTTTTKRENPKQTVKGPRSPGACWV